MKRTVQMSKGNITDPKRAHPKGGLRGVGKPKREWTPGPVIDFHKSYSRRVAAARAEQARIDAKRADATKGAA